MTYKVAKWKIVFSIIIFFYALPASLYRLPIFGLIQDCIGILCFLFFILHIKTIFENNSRILLMIIISGVVYTISTVANGTGMMLTFSLFKRLVKSIGPLSVIAWNLDRRKEEALGIIWKTLAGIVVVNFITIILFPNGMYISGAYSTNFFMGYHNSHIRWEVPMIMCKLLYDNIKRHTVTFSSFALCLIVLASSILVHSATSQIISVVLLGYILLEKAELLSKLRINSIHSLIILVAGSIIVVGGTILSNQITLLKNVLEYFGKGTTINGRGMIWLSSLEAIKNKMWLGYGFELSEETSRRLVDSVGWGSSPHNLLLEVLYMGGIALLICTIVIYVILYIKQKQCQSSGISRIIGVWLCIIAIMGIAEPQYEEYLKLCWTVSYGVLCLYTPGRIAYERVEK
ncbi:O-antigen ligase family protein [Enterocloster clostridioformis]|mgnify:FL=1|uniref:Lipid A core--O-antigen ligase-like protein n=2 Tax=Bacillota TaxID=1239 RepID=A0A174T9T6_9FIRM|nr:O-antigen ligase family protein [Enterocloster clostridioformis]CUQ04857.1 Lipid A core--O-antigen ligase-like protein [Enterocloster clostridioformis]